MFLTLNAGSSSIKFSLYDTEMSRQSRGQVENLGPAARMAFTHGTRKITADLGQTDHAGALDAILMAIDPLLDGRSVRAIGHRVVHGGPDFAAPVVLNAATLQTLDGFCPLAPLHQPHNLAAVRAAIAAFPDAVQVACFDTGFHRGHPWVNDTFAIPRHFYDEGVRRYGFHGLSYDYITGVLARDYPQLAKGRVVIAHLGNGASMCAVRDGKSIGSTMGFSALDGLAMGTRSGQLDPGVLLYLMGERGMSVQDVTHMLYKESGLLGLSGISHDMRTLLASDDPHAAQAIEYYVFRIRRELGAMAAVLGGLDGLVFCGGIGENASAIRAQVADNLGYLGLAVDPDRNDAGETVINSGETPILVIPTDEEIVLARAASAAVQSR